MRFRSRIDPALAGIVFVPLVGALGVAGVTGWSQGTLAGMLGIVAVAAVLGFVAWLYLDTSYVLTATELLIRCGPMRASVPLASVRQVRRSRTLIAAPALSLHRLEVDYGTYNQAVISPADIDGFLAALQARVPTRVIL